MTGGSYPSGLSTGTPSAEATAVAVGSADFPPSPWSSNNLDKSKRGFFSTFTFKWRLSMFLTTLSLLFSYLADENVVQWVNSVAWLFDVLCDGIRQQFVDNFLQVRAGDVADDDVVHLLADHLDLRWLSVARLTVRRSVLGGEPNAENAECVSVGGLDINVAFNQCLPFLDHGSERGKLCILKIWGYVVASNIIYLSLSVVRSIPWKLVSTLRPWTSSEMSLNLRKDLSASLSFCKSANETSNTRPFKPSEAILVPWVRLTNVLPTWRVANIDGALTSYQSLRVKGSMIFFLVPFLPPLAKPENYQDKRGKLLKLHFLTVHHSLVINFTLILKLNYVCKLDNHPYFFRLPSSWYKNLKRKERWEGNLRRRDRNRRWKIWKCVTFHMCEEFHDSTLKLSVMLKVIDFWVNSNH